MVSIKDVAKEVGVTPATVSMVVNGSTRISKKTSAKVQEVIKKLGYIPSSAAKTLKTHHSHTIGIIVGSLKNEFFMDIIAAVEDVCSSRGYELFVCDAKMSGEQALKSLRALRSRNVDGILLSFGFCVGQEFKATLEDYKTHGLQLLSFTDAVGNIPLVTYESKDALWNMLEKVYALGHRKFGVLGPRREEAWLNEVRGSIIRKFLLEKDAYDPALVGETMMSIKNGRESALQLLRAHPEITVLICVNDVVAVGALQAAKELCLRVPEDLSITGFDGIPFTQLTTPRITTICTPRYEMGRLGTTVLLDAVDGVREPSDKSEFIPSILMPGESIAGPRKGN
jgi:DNA-binding LacI/PurR family transcriptional regulator